MLCVFAGSKWRRTDLTYRISKYPRKVKKSVADREIARAFKVWSDVTPMNFIPKKEGRVHIDIRFVVSEHGDGDPFDGPGNTLAHAYFPQYGGDAHFDDEEYWTINSYSGTSPRPRKPRTANRAAHLNSHVCVRCRHQLVPSGRARTRPLARPRPQ